MTPKEEVKNFLKAIKLKMSIFGVIYLDNRSKNQQALLDLEITPAKRKEIIEQLKIEDYSEGPLDEKMHGILPLWIFGKEVKGKMIYIKISMGRENENAVCISFHIAEYPMNLPYK